MCRPIIDRPVEVPQQRASHHRRLRLVGDNDVDDTVGGLHRHRTNFLGPVGTQTATCDHRWTGHPNRGRFGRDNEVRAPGDHRVAGKAGSVDDADPRRLTRQASPQRERLRIECTDQRDIAVSGPSSPPSA